MPGRPSLRPSSAEGAGTLDWIRPPRPNDRKFPDGFDLAWHATITR